MINLYPPFLYQEETSDFSEVWENFCREVLKLELKSNNFTKRMPPEDGIDIFFTDRKTAYQCKSTSTGTVNGHNLTKIVDSYKRALNIKKDLQWEKYCLCLNYDLTGPQEQNIRKDLPDVEILPKSFWIDKARKHFLLLKDFFRMVISFKKERINETISSTFIPEYSDKLKNLLLKNKFEIFVWCNRNKSLYGIDVSLEFTIEDLLHIIKNSWPYALPEPTEIGSFKIGLSYAIVYNGTKHPFSKKLSEVGIKENDIVTFWTTISYKDNRMNRRSSDVMELVTLNNKITSAQNIISSDQAIEQYSDIVKKRFEQIDEALLAE
jgi:hypothetical protein